MKKLLIFILALTLFPIGIANAQMVSVDTPYNLTFIIDSGYDLETGNVTVDFGMARTNSATIKDESIKVDITKVHYILFWDEGFNYLGYFATPISSFNTNPLYLGLQFNDELAIPGNAKSFAFLVERLGVDREWQNGVTYKDVVELDTPLKAPQLIEEDFSNIDFVLPNGVEYFEMVGGTYTQRIKEYTLQAGDFLELDNTKIYIQGVRIKIPSLADNSPLISNRTYIEGFRVGIDYADNSSSIGSHWPFNSSIYQIWLIVAKDTYANLTEARNDLQGTKILYQLATPIEVFDIAQFKADELFAPLYEDTFNNLSDSNIKEQIDYWINSNWEWYPQTTTFELTYAEVDEVYADYLWYQNYGITISWYEFQNVTAYYIFSYFNDGIADSIQNVGFAMLFAALAIFFMVFGIGKQKGIFNLFSVGAFIAFTIITQAHPAILVISVGFILFNLYYAFLGGRE